MPIRIWVSHADRADDKDRKMTYCAPPSMNDTESKSNVLSNRREWISPHHDASVCGM
ncbi:MAG: hypothetical protein OEM82_02995 [Acidobacteriota bacterium]|nr:hypothetical protein [Acidobacteriota bacterium]